MTKYSPNISISSDHAFIERVLQDSLPYLRPGQVFDSAKLQPNERYIQSTGYYVGQVLNQTERVDQAAILINSYPYVREWRTRYGRFEYFQYHMEQYFIALSGLVDRLFLLFNHLYGIGMDDEGVRYSTLHKELLAKGHADEAELLKNIRDSMRFVKKKKNHYTHLVRFWEKDLWRIGVLEFSLRNKTIPDPDGYLKADLDFDTKIYLKEKMKLIKDNEKPLLDILERSFDKFEIIYNKNVSHTP